MCGIAGIHLDSRDATPDAAMLGRMVAAIRHRGPDGNGYHGEPGLGLGHARLSIIDLAGGGYFRILPYALVRHGLRRINHGQRQPFFFYLHPWEIDPGQPRIEAGLKSRLRHYTGLASCEARLERLVGEFGFDAMADVLDGIALPSATVRA